MLVLKTCGREKRGPLEGVPDARREPEHVLTIRRQTLDPPGHQGDDVVRRGGGRDRVNTKHPLPARPIERQQPVVLQCLQELNDEKRVAIRLLANQGRQPRDVGLVRTQRVREERQESRLVKRTQRETAHESIVALQAIDRRRERVIRGDLVIAVGADDKQRSRIGIREHRVQQFERRSVGPLQVVEKDDEWMLGPGKGPDEAAEHVAKAVLRFDRLQRNGRRLFADDEFDLRNDGRDDPTIRAKGLGQGGAPASEAFLAFGQHLPDQASKRLYQCAVRDVASDLVKLATDEVAALTNDRPEQFVDERRLADARIAPDQ